MDGVESRDHGSLGARTSALPRNPPPSPSPASGGGKRSHDHEPGSAPSTEHSALGTEFLWDDPYRTPRQSSRSRAWALRVGVGLALIGFVGALAAGAWSLLSEKGTTRRQVVQITLLKPPPPPPPPPPAQKPPEPEVKQELKIPEPQEQPKQDEQAPPPGEQLGLDANASGNGDGFGLVAKKGGTDITKIGGPAGDGDRERAWFAGLVQSYLQTELSKNERLRHANYKVVIWLWFTPDGHIQRAEVRDSTGNAELDKNLKLALDQIPPMSRAPPADIPQPVKLRVTSAGAG